jgi:hypothetical protein
MAASFNAISSPPLWEVICLAADVALARCLTQAKPIQSYNSGLGLVLPEPGATKLRGCSLDEFRPVELQFLHPSLEHT